MSPMVAVHTQRELVSLSGWYAFIDSCNLSCTTSILETMLLIQACTYGVAKRSFVVGRWSARDTTKTPPPSTPPASTSVRRLSSLVLGGLLHAGAPGLHQGATLDPHAVRN